MVYIKATVDGSTVYLQKIYDGTWSIMNEAPSYPGINPITVQIIVEGENINVIGYNDPTLTEFLKLLVFHKSRTNLIEYLPMIMQEVIEFKAFTDPEDFEIDRLHDDLQEISGNAFILTSSAARVAEWEKDLQIIALGTIAQRKSYVLSFLRSSGKLNEAKIKDVVNAFSGGEALVTFSNSQILVQVLLPPEGEEFIFDDISKALEPKLPAHIALLVQRLYGTWNNIKTTYSSWNDVALLTDWQAVKDYIPEI